MMGMMDQMMSMGASRMGGGMSTGGMASALLDSRASRTFTTSVRPASLIDHGSHITLTVEQQKQLGEIKEQSLLDQATLQRKIDQAEQELWDLTGSDCAGLVQDRGQGARDRADQERAADRVHPRRGQGRRRAHRRAAQQLTGMGAARSTRRRTSQLPCPAWVAAAA
jgi:hypothetical protein